MTEQQLLEQENVYAFDRFTHADAARFGEAIVSLAREHGEKPVGVRVVVGNTTVFQYLMDGKDSDAWLEKKQRTVLRSGHSSLWVRAVNDETHEFDGWREEGCAICGGGFPLTVGGMLAGCLCASGLAHEEDHQLILDAITKMKEGKAK